MVLCYFYIQRVQKYEIPSLVSSLFREHPLSLINNVENFLILFDNNYTTQRLQGNFRIATLVYFQTCQFGGITVNILFVFLLYDTARLVNIILYYLSGKHREIYGQGHGMVCAIQSPYIPMSIMLAGYDTILCGISVNELRLLPSGRDIARKIQNMLWHLQGYLAL